MPASIPLLPLPGGSPAGPVTFLVDPAGHIVTWPGPARLRYGHSPDWALGRGWTDLLAPENAPVADGLVEAALPDARVVHRGLHRTVQGEQFRAIAYLTGQPAAGGNAERVAITVVPAEFSGPQAVSRTATLLSLGQRLNEATTTESAAQIALQAADELLTWDACFLELTDLEAGHTQTVVMVDTIDGAKTPVTPPGSRIPPLAARAMRSGPVLVLREPGSQPVTSRFGDKSRSSASLMCVPIRIGGQPIGALSIQSYTFHAYDEEDLHTLQGLADYCAGALQRTWSEAARRDLEEQLGEAIKMEAIARLAGGVAHDNNNMLAVINGYAELLLGMTDPGSSVHSGLREIRNAGERASDLTRQLLAFSRRQILQPAVLDLNRCVRSLEPTLRQLLPTNVELVIRLDPELGTVRVDPGQVEQILVNLTANARDAMPNGGRLSFETDHVRIEPSLARVRQEPAPGSYVRLTISDTGPGMDTQTAARVFEPFFTTKEVGKGTGLGLAMVYGIVKQSDGHITLDTAPGAGTTFRIYLPLASM